MIRSTFHPVLKSITLNKERRYDLRQPVCPCLPVVQTVVTECRTTAVGNKTEFKMYTTAKFPRAPKST